MRVSVGPHPALVLGVADAGRPVLAAAGAEHDDLGTDERADRGLVLERAGDADHEDVVHVDRVEEPLDAGGGELGAHAGDDRHDLAVVERSAMHGQTVDVGLGQLELGHQRCELHRHGAHEGQRSRGHPGSLPHGGRGRQRSTCGSAPGLVAPG